MNTRLATIAALACLAMTAAFAEGAAAPSGDSRSDSLALAFPLPERGPLARKQDAVRGPRLAWEWIGGTAVTLWGAAGEGRRMLVAGCANGRRCAGEDVLRAMAIGCPPDDADTWLLRSLRPGSDDLDARPEHPGAATWRQAVADLRPHLAVVFRTGQRPSVRAAGPSAAVGLRYARWAGLPFSARAAQGLASWTVDALPGARAITVELPAGRVDPRTASRLAWALDRLAGTRFAGGAQEERARMIARGVDPRHATKVMDPKSPE